MTTIAVLGVEVNADIGSFQSGMQTVSREINTVGSNMTRIGDNMSRVGQNMAAVTVPITAALGYAVVQATEFNTAMTNVNSILQLGAEDAAAMNAEILQIGTSATAGPQAVAAAMYDIVGGVADAANHIPILNAAIATAEAGAADLGATTQALISSMNAYGASADQASHFSDVLTASVAAGVGSMDGLAAAMPQVSGLANTLGVSFDSLGGMMAYVTTKGSTWSEAATQINGVMMAMINPSETLQGAIAGIGFSSTQAALETLGLQGTLQAIADSGVDITSLGFTVEGLRGAIALTSEGATEFATNFASSIDGATEAARAIQLTSTQSQFDLLRSSVDGLAITLGSSLTIALAGAATFLTPIINGVTQWAAANPELSGTLVAVVGGAALLGAAMIPLGVIISGLGTVFTLFAAAVAAPIFPFIVIAGVVTGLVMASGSMAQVGEAFDGVGTAISNLKLDDVQSWLNLGGALLNLGGVTFGAIADGVISVVNALTGGNIGSFTDAINNAWLALQAGMILAETGFKNFGLGIQLSIQTMISDLRNTILEASAGAIDIAPNIQMDIAATQGQIQANLDEAAARVTALTSPVTTDVTVTAGTVDTTAVNASIDMGLATDVSAPIRATTVVVDATMNGGVIDATPVNQAIQGAVGQIQTDYSIHVNVHPTFDSPEWTTSGGIGAPATTSSNQTMTVPSGSSGADISGEGLMYVHANEKLLNAADTEAYNRGAGGGGGQSVQQTFIINSYGSSPYELYRMNKRAMQDAAPG